MPENPGTHQISHFAINADNCERALAFYQAVFGWQFDPWGPPGFFIGQVGNLKASIQQSSEHPVRTPIGNFEVSISVEDVDKTLALIEANGGQITMPKVTILNVCELARVKDCEGNTFSVARYL